MRMSKRAKAFGILLVLLLLLLLSLFFAPPAKADYRIRDDNGGRIGDYIEKYERIRRTGDRVVFDGRCVSGCTLALGIIPPGRMCSTVRARLGFHAAWKPDIVGLPEISRGGTQLLRAIYPQHINAWIDAHDALASPFDIKYLEGQELAQLVPRCTSRKK